jgi:hypothetical protein
MGSGGLAVDAMAHHGDHPGIKVFDTVIVHGIIDMAIIPYRRVKNRQGTHRNRKTMKTSQGPHDDDGPPIGGP